MTAYLPPIPPKAKAHHAAQALIKDAKRGPAMATNVQQHLTGLGRAQLAEIVAALFAELAAHRDHPKPNTETSEPCDKQDGDEASSCN